jgi:nucleoside-diphosphate-sugar epimerase
VRVLLLGGTDLIGTATVAELVERDVEVHVWNRGLSEDRLPGNVVQRVVDRREIHWGRGGRMDGLLAPLQVGEDGLQG